MGAGPIATRNDIPGRSSTGFLRWREHRQVSAIARQLICSYFPISNGGQLATQELDWRAMLQCRTFDVDNSDPRTLLQAIVDEVQQFGPQELRDDITLVVAKCT